MRATQEDLVLAVGRYGEGSGIHLRLNVVEDEEGKLIRVGIVDEEKANQPVKALDHHGVDLDVSEATRLLAGLTEALREARS